jgi:Holliday junction resolvase-like predicted endonuclease
VLAIAPRLALRLWEPHPAELGWIGETVAARLARRRGLRLLARRLRTPWAELDLVALDRRRRTLVAVEVKTKRIRGPERSDERHWQPADSLRPDQWRRSWFAARATARSMTVERARLELCEVWVLGPRRNVEVRWTAELGRGTRPRGSRSRAAERHRRPDT